MVRNAYALPVDSEKLMPERLARLLRIHQKIKLLHLTTGRKETCSVLTRRTADGHYEVELRTGHEAMMTVRAEADDGTPCEPSPGGEAPHR